MAEIVLSRIAEEIIGRLASAAVQEVGLLWGVKGELSGLEDTIFDNRSSACRCRGEVEPQWSSQKLA